MPSGNPRVRCVDSFEALVDARFEAGVNALCWRRELAGDFAEVARALADLSGVTPLDEQRLGELSLSGLGKRAVEVMLRDVRALQERELAPELNYVTEYPRDAADSVIATDVYSFHVDRAPFEVDTWLCTYHGAPSEGLSNEDAIARVDVDVTRAALLREFGGVEGREFGEFLRENSYDLHYLARPGARPWSFGVGNLWRVTTGWPGAPVPPCIHRAPVEAHGPGRLLLIS